MRVTLLLLTVCGLLAACAGEAPADPAATGASSQLAAALPALAQLRVASGAYDTTFDGSLARSRSGGASIVGSSMHLPAAAGELEWAIYALPSNGFPVERLRVRTSFSDSGPWIGVSNFTRGCWEFVGQAGSAIYSHPLSADNVSPEGYVWAVIATWDSADASVITMWIVLDEPDWTVVGVTTGDAQPKGVCLFADGPDGLPHIAYVDDRDRSIKVARAPSMTPTAIMYWDLVPVDSRSTGDLELPLDAEFIAGTPAVAYREVVSHALYYAYAGSAEPSELADWTIVHAATFDDTGTYELSLAESGNSPRIVFCDGAPPKITYAYSNSATPLAFTKYNVASGCYHPDLEVINGTLALSMFDTSGAGTDLVYATPTASVPINSDYWLRVHVQNYNPDDYSGSTALAALGSSGAQQPVLGCISNIVGTFDVLAATQAEPGAADWTAVRLLDTAAYQFDLCAGQRASIVFSNTSEMNVVCGHATVAQPDSRTDWELSLLAEDTVSNGISCCEVAGRPAVAWNDYSDSMIYYAYRDE